VRGGGLALWKKEDMDRRQPGVTVCEARGPSTLTCFLSPRETCTKEKREEAGDREERRRGWREVSIRGPGEGLRARRGLAPPPPAPPPATPDAPSAPAPPLA